MPKNQNNRRRENSPEAAADPGAAVGLKRILVPIDFSDSARKALQYALAFARQFEAEITVMHVVPNVTAESRLAYDMPELQQALFKEGQEKLEKELEHAGSEAANLKVLIKKGVPWNEIVLAAQQGGIDLIVLGTHGRTGLKHVLLGSTAERVVRHGPCPVLIVREREHEFV